jgi:hypothetical protein
MFGRSKESNPVVEYSLGRIFPSIVALLGRTASPTNHPIHKNWSTGLVSTDVVKGHLQEK